MSRILVLSLVLHAIVSCNKLEENPEGEVDIFLLESYDLVGGEFSSAIDESTVVVQSEPFIPYEGFRYYHSSDHAFKLTNEFRDRVVDRDFPVGPTAFGVYANGELVYTGYFIPSTSSIACAWTTIDPLFVEYDGRLQVELGYPGEFEKAEVPDRRNDERILAIFKRDGKLK